MSTIGQTPQPPVTASGSGRLIEGKKDPYLQRWVVDLIYQEGRLGDESKPLFVVYLDEEFAIQWYFNPATGQSDEKYFPVDFNLILNDVVHLETLSQGLRKPPIGKFSFRNEQEKKGFDHGVMIDESTMDFSKMKASHSELRATRRLAAEALARTYEYLPDLKPGEEDPRMMSARVAVSMAQAHLRARSSDVGRSYLLYGALMATFVCFLVVLLFTFLYSNSPEGYRRKLEQAESISAKPWSPSDENQPVATLEIDTLTSTVRVSRPETQSMDVDADQTEDLLKSADELIEERQKILSLSNWITRDVWNVLCYSLAGAFGAMLSVMMSASKREYDAGAGRKIHLLEGASRILIGILGAAFITLAINANLFLGFASQAAGGPGGGGVPTLVWVHYVFGFVAGVSEQFVPSFIKVVEAQAQSTSQEVKK